MKHIPTKRRLFAVPDRQRLKLANHRLRSAPLKLQLKGKGGRMIKRQKPLKVLLHSLLSATKRLRALIDGFEVRDSSTISTHMDKVLL